jgi:hypothetical protein
MGRSCKGRGRQIQDRAGKKTHQIGIKGSAKSKWSKLDRVIAGHYFQSNRLKLPLRELSANKASTELRKLEVEISPRQFEHALRRLHLVV